MCLEVSVGRLLLYLSVFVDYDEVKKLKTSSQRGLKVIVCLSIETRQQSLVGRASGTFSYKTVGSSKIQDAVLAVQLHFWVVHMLAWYDG